MLRIQLSFVLMALAPGMALAESFALPTMQVELRNVSDGSAVAGFHPTVSGLNAIGVPAMRAAHPELTGAGQTVVVIDTGIDYTHAALSSNYLTGFDFTTGTADPMDNWAGGGGHGTHVSGIIASTDALRPGVAPGVKIIGLKVFDSATGLAEDTSVVAALNWVAEHRQEYNITAVNMSLGDSVETTWSTIPANNPFEGPLQTLKQQGVFVTAASGNDSFLHGQSMPAASRYVVSVGATYASSDWVQYMVSAPGSLDPYKWADANGVLQDAFTFDNGPIQNDIAFFTNRYKTANDGATSLMAPGIFITSSIPLGFDTEDGVQDGWTDYAGTSMAAPQVTGASVLVRQALEEAGLLDPDPAKQVDQILKILEDTGVPLYDNFWFFGGNNSTLMEVPPGSQQYVIGRGTGETYMLIDLDAAVGSVLPVPEGGTLGVLGLGVMVLVRRRRRGGACCDSTHRI